MRRDIVVPRMGESINEASIGQILKPSGSQVKAEEEILELETDKVNQVLYAPASGLLTLTVKSEETVKIGQVIGSVETEKSEASPTTPKSTTPTTEGLVQKRETASASRARETKAHFLAELKQPAKEAKEEQPPASLQKPIPNPEEQPHQEELTLSPVTQEKRETRRKMTRVRRLIAERLIEAQRSSAMLTTFNEVDMTQVIDLRTRHQEAFTKRYGAKLGFMSFFVKAVVSALREIPELNSYIDGEDIVHREYYDMGIAVNTERGLIVPVVKECDLLTFGQIESLIASLARKAREGGLTVDELSGGGFTITNGGVFGSLLSTPILNPPQSGILAMHRIQERPVVKDGVIVIRPMMYTALSYDHRIVDGKGAVSFLVHLKEFLEDPARILLEI